MKCIKCGNDILQTDNFCDACGARVMKLESDSNVEGATHNNVGQKDVSDSLNEVNVKEDSSTQVTSINDDSAVKDTSIDANYFDNMLNNDNNNPSSDDKSIGFHISEDDLFDNGTTSVDTKNNSFFRPRRNYSTTYKDRNVNGTKKYILIGCFSAICIILIVVGVLLLSNSSTSLVCKSNEGSISIKFSDDDIIAYVGEGVSYNIEEQRVIFKQIGFSQYISQFNEWFTSNTSGSCKYDGKEIARNETTKDNSLNLSGNINANYSSITVGDDFYGRVDIPTNWTRFYDESGSSSLQYSYADVFIVSLDVIESGGYTAKDHASSYALRMKEDSSISDVTTSTVKIGKNNEYTAYQVYMYYPNFSEYLITYWFDTGDGDVHYIALEGPSEANSMKLTDFLAIPQSFH